MTTMPVPEHGSDPRGTSSDVDFAPRTAVRRGLGLVLLVAAVGAATSAVLAVQRGTVLTMGLAGTLGVTALVLWGIRATIVPTRLAVRSSQLVVERGRHREVFDLSSRYTPIEEVGVPGRRGWRVLLGRFGAEPLVIDSSLVDPRTFSAVLARHRPD